MLLAGDDASTAADCLVFSQSCSIMVDAPQS